MQKRLISVCIIVFLVCGIFGYVKMFKGISAAEPESMEAEHTGTEEEHAETEHTEVTETADTEEIDASATDTLIEETASKERKADSKDGEPITVVVKKTLYNPDGSVDSWHDYEYDSVGNMTKDIYYWGSDGTLLYRYEYEYDSKLTKETYYGTDGDIDGWNEYEYDNAGNQTKKIWSDSNGKSSVIWEKEYDSAGNEAKRISYGYNDSVNRDEYEYDSAGNKSKWIGYDKDGNIDDWYEYEYDRRGNKTKETRYHSDGSIWYWSEYEYDSAGKQIKNTSYKSDGSIRAWEEYEYDSEGYEKKYTVWDCEIGVEYWREYDYDGEDTGDRIKKFYHDSNGTISEHEYDSAGNHTKHILYDNDLIISGDEWEYDSLGNLTKYTYTIEGVIVEYEYITITPVTEPETTGAENTETAIVEEEAEQDELEPYYGFYRISEFRPSREWMRGIRYDDLPTQEADMLLGRIVELKEDRIVTYDSFRRLGSRDGRDAFSCNYMIENICIEKPRYSWEPLDAETIGSELYFHDEKDWRTSPYRELIQGKISVEVTESGWKHRYYAMSEGILMSSVSGQLFYLEKLEEEPEQLEETVLSAEEKNEILRGLLGSYTIVEFLPTKFYPAPDSVGDPYLPEEEAELMIGKEIAIEEDLFVSYDSFRRPNSEYVKRAMDDFWLEKVEIQSPDYRIEERSRDRLYGLRDDMLRDELLHDRYIEISVYPGYRANGERCLPQLYLLDDGRIIMYAMGEYFLLEK